MRVGLVISLAVVSLAGCATGPESVQVVKKGSVTFIHHRRRTSNGAIDRIEAINAKGVLTQAEIHVYDVGRLVDPSGNVHEAHQVYRTVQSARPNLMLPRGTSSGPRTVYTPPNYVPPPNDQRINDAVAEAKKAKEHLEATDKQMQEKIAQDNALRGQLQEQIDQNQQLQNQLNAAFNTPNKQSKEPQTEAGKEAASDIDALQQWGAQVQ